ncbi:protein tyrosine phosphatase [Opitutia bacterium ISCC 51]|nr:protein tyrosine phosphatase [Opitutae bacterium ISCC 51]QXD27553.1 protein tyrosine phosphatase [Opitutae bacterium ISCC 52]
MNSENPPRKLLFICSRNKSRSYTAEKLYEKLDQYQVRSRGTENGSRIKVTEGDIGWADIIFTMETRHSHRLKKKFPDKIVGKRPVTLFIKDIYDPLDPKLIEELKQKLSPHIEVPE